MTDEFNHEPANEQPPDSVTNEESAPVESSGEDFVSDRSENEPAAEFGGQDIESLREQISELQDRMLRSQAELDNFRRRSAREIEEVRKYQSLPVVRDLLPVMDNLGRAVQSAEQTGDVTSLLEGIRMVAEQLGDTLKSHSAEAVSPAGESFDPNFHEALSQVPTSEHPPMTVLQVIETGYRIHDRIVRPAKVIVSCAPPDVAPAESEGE